VPGTSRSLATLVGGRAAGLSHAAAAEFSFLLGFLTLTAASAYKAWKLGPALVAIYPAGPALLGLAVAFVVAYATAGWLVRHLQSRGFVLFAWYRIALGGSRKRHAFPNLDGSRTVIQTQSKKRGLRHPIPPILEFFASLD
jgi:undecaprenyl-diphosphatase